MFCTGGWLSFGSESSLELENIVSTECWFLENISAISVKECGLFFCSKFG